MSVKTFTVTMTETFEWTDDIEAESISIAESIAHAKWMNGEYTDKDSCSGVGDFTVKDVFHKV